MRAQRAIASPRRGRTRVSDAAECCAIRIHLPCRESRWLSDRDFAAVCPGAHQCRRHPRASEHLAVSGRQRGADRYRPYLEPAGGRGGGGNVLRAGMLGTPQMDGCGARPRGSNGGGARGQPALYRQLSRQRPVMGRAAGALWSRRIGAGRCLAASRPLCRQPRARRHAENRSAAGARWWLAQRCRSAGGGCAVVLPQRTHCAQRGAAMGLDRARLDCACHRPVRLRALSHLRLVRREPALHLALVSMVGTRGSGLRGKGRRAMHGAKQMGGTRHGGRQCGRGADLWRRCRAYAQRALAR